MQLDWFIILIFILNSYNFIWKILAFLKFSLKSVWCCYIKVCGSHTGGREVFSLALIGIILHYVKSLLYVSISPHYLSSFTSLPIWDFKSWQVSFSNEPWMMAIIFIINKIYQKRKLQKIYSKTIIKRFLYKLITEVSFWFNYQLVKQTDDSTICFILENINMIRMEIDTVARPIF